MAYDDGLAQRIREILSERTDLVEKKMFGGLAFMVAGNMSVGVTDDKLMVRVGADGHAEALREPHVGPMDFTGRPLKGFVYVDTEGIAEDDDLAAWVERGVSFASSLPAK
jgi:TfoX/Sxy family transcriptional regulator of competence genes